MKNLDSNKSIMVGLTQVSSGLNSLFYRHLVEESLKEDLGRGGDITTEAIVDPDAIAEAVIASRSEGVIAGLSVALFGFFLLDSRMEVNILKRDGEKVYPGDTLLHLKGNARALLTAERTGLNLLGRMSGIATATRQLSDLISHTKAKVVDTRKTTPGLRALEKYSVRMGGGQNHRMGLDDMILIKDNHIAYAKSISDAVEKARARVGHTVKIEVEVDTLVQLEEVMKTDADIVMLDNMNIETLKAAVKMVGGRKIVEASGGVDARTIVGIAETGVDLISVGALTHSVINLDVGLDFIS